MALNVSDPKLITQEDVYRTGSKTESPIQPETTDPPDSSPLAIELQKLNPNLSQEKNRMVMVDVSKEADQMSMGEYEEVFLKTAFQQVGLNNVTAAEIAAFQRDFNTIAKQRIGFDNGISVEQLHAEQQRQGSKSIVVNISDYDIAVLKVAKQEILLGREKQQKRLTQAMEKSQYYAEDAIAGFYKLQLNGLINNVNAVTRVVEAPAIPRLEVNGEYWQKGKAEAEMATTITAGYLISKMEGVGAVTTTLGVAGDSVEAITGKEYRTGRELSTEERAQRVIFALGGMMSLREPVEQFTGKAANKATDTIDKWRTKSGGSNGNGSGTTPATVEMVTPEGAKIPVSVEPLPHRNSLLNQSQQPTISTAEEIEQAAKAKARQLELQDNGHSVDRHGPEISDTDLAGRLTTGIAPDGKISSTSASTRFNSYKDWVETRQTALEAIEKRESIDLTKPPQQGEKLRHEVIVEHSRAIDDGFIGTPGTKTKAIDPATGKKISVFTQTEAIDGITRTKTLIEWNANKQQWDIKQHYPNADGWNNATKTYSYPADYTVSKQ